MLQPELLFSITKASSGSTRPGHFRVEPLDPSSQGKLLRYWSFFFLCVIEDAASGLVLHWSRVSSRVQGPVYELSTGAYSVMGCLLCAQNVVMHHSACLCIAKVKMFYYVTQILLHLCIKNTHGTNIYLTIWRPNNFLGCRAQHHIFTPKRALW